MINFKVWVTQPDGARDLAMDTMLKSGDILTINDLPQISEEGRIVSFQVEEISETPLGPGDPCPTCGEALVWDAQECLPYCVDDWCHG
jgi:hypothetical protein